MTCCPHCRDAGEFFGERTARRELRRFRRRGPPKATRLLLDALEDAPVEGASLLDVGGGIGAIQHQLFEAGLRSAVQVDASAGYLEQSRREAERRGNGDRVRYVYGDFVDLAGEMDDADLVTLDRVVCCYPDVDALLGAATARARRAVGLVYPRERLGTRLALALGNLWQRLRRRDFRVYLHSSARVHALMPEAGLRLDRGDRTFLWRVEVWVRATTGPIQGFESTGKP